jgi:hypothetical protein
VKSEQHWHGKSDDDVNPAFQGSFSTELGSLRHVWSSPDSDRMASIAGGPVRANNKRLMHRSKWHLHSITSSARASSDGETASPIALVVLRLTASSNRAGCSTGSSTGLAPLRIFAT